MPAVEPLSAGCGSMSYFFVAGQILMRPSRPPLARNWPFGGKRQRRDGAHMGFDGGEFLAVGVPKFDGLVPAGRGDFGTVGGDSDGPDAFVGFVGGDFFAGIDVDELDFAVEIAGDEFFAVGAEGERGIRTADGFRLGLFLGLGVFDGRFGFRFDGGQILCRWRRPRF